MNPQPERTTRQGKAKQLLGDAANIVKLKELVAQGEQRYIPQQSQRRPTARR
jgi:hypothetical protein